MAAHPRSEPTLAAFEPHDHDACAADAAAALERVAAVRGARVTPVRRRVFEMLWESHRPVAAYELLGRLRAEGLGSQPPSVYRALDFLIEHGFAHKLLRLNAFIGCAHPGEPHRPLFLICAGCGRVGELRNPDLHGALSTAAARQRFTLSDAAIEIEGYCLACAEAPQDDPREDTDEVTESKAQEDG